MMLKRAVYLIVFLLVSIAGQSQINVYLGGNLQANYSWIRGGDASMEPGFGGGVNFVYWEYEYWFMKAGIDYYRKTSTMMDYPDDYGVEPENADDKINITFTEQSVGIPLTVYFRPYEWGANTILLTGSLTTLFVISLKENSEEYGEIILKGTDLKTRIKTNVGIGVGYQRQLDKHLFLNFIPSYNIDLRGDKAFNSVTLTAELIFGIY
jgi:hypothetical protein